MAVLVEVESELVAVDTTVAVAVGFEGEEGSIATTDDRVTEVATRDVELLFTSGGSTSQSIRIKCSEQHQVPYL